MGLHKKYKRSQYDNLRKALKRNQVNNSGVVASLFLDIFIDRNGRMAASEVSANRICKDGEFSKWRSEMISKGWLEWSATQSDKGQYFSGRKLIKYINRELQETKQLATVEQIHDLDMRKAEADDVNDLKARMNAIEEAVSRLVKASAPPDNEEKKQERTRATTDLEDLTQPKLN